MREYSIGIARALEPILPPHFVHILHDTGPTKVFEKGSQIYRQGDEAAFVYLLLKGRVKTTLMGAAGQEAILRIHLPHNILGLTALGTSPIRDGTAVCLDPVSVVQIKRTQFLGLMRDEPEFSTHIVQLLIDRMSDFHYRVGDWLSQSVEQRVSQALLALSMPDETDENTYALDIPLTHEEIAQLVNTRRPTVSKTLANLEKRGCVKQTGRKLVVLDRASLAAHVEADAKEIL